MIESFTQKVIEEEEHNLNRAIKIYNAIRDGWKYTASKITLSEEDMKATEIYKRQEGNCIEKSVLMIACCRAANIPARLCLAKVRNQNAVENVEQTFGKDYLVPHGYVELWLNEKWVKATPAFNKSLCKRLGVEVLPFDGINDSIFQQYDQKGGIFMEYLEDYGWFDDIPIDYIIEVMRENYPLLIQKGYKIEKGSVIDLK